MHSVKLLKLRMKLLQKKLKAFKYTLDKPTSENFELPMVTSVVAS